jgi:hypothetical protein
MLAANFKLSIDINILRKLFFTQSTFRRYISVACLKIHKNVTRVTKLILVKLSGILSKNI